MSHVTFDLETSVATYLGRKASPFNPKNNIIAIGWKRDDGEVLHSYDKDGKHSRGWFANLLSTTKLLVGQNIKFDLLYALLRDPESYPVYQVWVANGGLIWDIQLAEYLLNGQDPGSHMLSMDEMVERYGGDLKIDEVKALWEAGVDTADIDKDLLLRYLCGETLKDGTRRFGDIENTENVFKQQLAKARKTKQLKSILMNMGSLLASTEMELNGLATDEALGIKQAAILKSECDRLRGDLQKFLPDDLPFEWNWGSGHQLSALIFGGKVPYKARQIICDDDGKPVYATKDTIKVYEVGSERELLVGVDIQEDQVEAMAAAGGLMTFKGGAKKGLVKTSKAKMPDMSKGPKERWEDFEYTFPGMTKPEKEWETKREGVYQTNADVIEKLATRGIPFLDELTKLNKMDKDLTTYYITTDDKGNHKGMLTLVGPDGIIHGSINHTSTVTGRFSASKPNLQNIPRSDTSDVKKLFISRWGTQGSIIQSDFSSLEIYVQALLTGDKQLLADLKAGLDMHCKRVASKFGIPYEEAVLRCKKNVSAEDFKLWKSRRTGAKEFSFQRAFGAGAPAIAYATGMALKDVEDLIELEKATYPQVERFYERVTDRINEARVPTNRFEWHPEIRGLKVQIGKSNYTTPDGKMYTYREYPAPAGVVRKTGREASFSPPEIKNYIVQGTGGEWAKAAMWLAVRYFYHNKNFGGKALLVNMVHDAQYVDAHESVRSEAAAALHAAMEAASEFIEQRFDWEVKAPVPSETKFGPAMYYEYDFHCDTVNEKTGEIIQATTCPDFFAKVRAKRLEIRKLYLNDYIPSFEREAA